jgi:hypothetical protein
VDSRSIILILCGIASGLGLVAIAVVVPSRLWDFPSAMWCVPGFVFAATVVVPWSLLCGHGFDRVFSDARSCVVGYVAALGITGAGGYGYAPVGAFVGAWIMLRLALKDPSKEVGLAARRGLATGTITALVFVVLEFVPKGFLEPLLGIAVWQAAVAGALASVLPQRVRPAALPAARYNVDGGVS